jgi:hypothetical protein
MRGLDLKQKPHNRSASAFGAESCPHSAVSVYLTWLAVAPSQIDAAVEVRAAYTGSAICVAFGGVKDLPDAWKFRTGGFSCVVVCAPAPPLWNLEAQNRFDMIWFLRIRSRILFVCQPHIILRCGSTVRFWTLSVPKRMKDKDVAYR